MCARPCGLQHGVPGGRLVGAGAGRRACVFDKPDRTRRQRMRYRLMTVLALALPLSLCAQESGRVVVPVISMKDQYDKPHDVKDFRGDVAVLIYGDKTSAKANSEL